MQNKMQDCKTFYDQALSNQGLPLLLVYNKIHKGLRSSKRKHKFLVYGRKSSNKISTNKKIFTTYFYEQVCMISKRLLGVFRISL